MPTRARATSLAELSEIQARMIKPEEVKQGLNLQLRFDDIVITPFGKSGTTWIQQIVHTLRTRGDMDFDDISRVVPWIETSPALGIDLDAEQITNPRAFKSHLEYEAIPKGGKYINVVRDPKDALYSAYKFFEGWFFEPGTIGLEDFARERFIKSGAYWRHLKSWWQRRHQTTVLFLAYELMKLDLDVTIRRVAEFIDIPLDEELLELTLLHASLPFMLQHKDRFDDAMLRSLTEDRCNLPFNSDTTKVRQGEIGSHTEAFSPELIAGLDEVWRTQITEPLGYPDYESLIKALD
ncbi:MAG: sulfotransferase domain-containing protein [bacterium]|nr:sulfotransferase domain-containing protein [Gammaproteobacteria bacterium]HIL97398.1 sulfotransferase domain-containing protein [Pseudomonadales bacterium]